MCQSLTVQHLDLYVTQAMLGRLQLFDDDFVQNHFRKTLNWDAIDQILMWKLLVASRGDDDDDDALGEKIAMAALDCVQMENAKHGEAISGLLAFFKANRVRNSGAVLARVLALWKKNGGGTDGEANNAWKAFVCCVLSVLSRAERFTEEMGKALGSVENGGAAVAVLRNLHVWRAMCAPGSDAVGAPEVQKHISQLLQKFKIPAADFSELIINSSDKKRKRVQTDADKTRKRKVKRIRLEESADD
eukprot:TRINITY_DN5686_c0_g1_i1.p1 TRINITY_DN5686_c0_g1~~TRINITY_DN5686_c0_g1_i1.p1  ORF type:complete len:246 (-),score=68.12 TRINITY_DN5686_c0_g1_i1:89-826(-)